MPERILGIDVGSWSIKVAEFERKFRSFQLVGFFEQPIIVSEALGKEASTSQALHRLFEEYDLSRDQVYTVLPGQSTSLRLIDLPFADLKKVDATIEFEMEGYLPLPMEDLLIDYQFLETGKTGSTVLASYAKKSEFVKFLHLMSGSDLDPRFVGCEPVEMVNLTKLGVLQQQGACAVLDMGHEKTNVAIFVDSQLRYARTIMIGGQDLTRSIAESLNIPPAEAEKMKVEMGRVGIEMEGVDDATRSLSEAMKGPLKELLLQLKQTFMAFQEKRKEAVQALLLCGGTSRLPGIDHYLSSELRKNVSFLDCLDFPFNQLADSQWCRPVAASALSAAARGIFGLNVRDIQFRRGEFAYRGEARNMSQLIKQVALLLGVVTLFGLGSFIFSYATLKGRTRGQLARVSAVAGEVLPDLPKKTLSDPKAVVSLLAGKTTEAEEKRKKIEEETRLSVLEVLREFSATLPSRDKVKLDVDDLTIASKRVRLQGRTSSSESVDQIKAALEGSKLFKSVSKENLKKGLRDEVRFSLSIELAPEGV